MLQSSLLVLVHCLLGAYGEQCLLRDEQCEDGVPDVTFLQTSSSIADSTVFASGLQGRDVFEDMSDVDARPSHRITSLAENAVGLYNSESLAKEAVAKELAQLMLGAALQRNSSTNSSESTTTTTTTESTSELVSGATANTGTDWSGLYLPCLYYGLGCFILAAIWISLMRTRVPNVYAHRTMEIKTDKYTPIPGEKSIDLGQGTFAWLWAGFNISITDITRFSGLDHGMLVLYAELLLKIVLAVGIPLSGVLVPIYYSAGKSDGFMIRFELMNLDENPTSTKNWAIWGAAGGVWYAVLVSEFLIFRAMREFIPKRFRWIKEMSPPRATSVLLTTIPEGRNTEEEITKYFNVEVFGRVVVKRVYITKDTSSMKSIMSRHSALELEYQKAAHQGKATQASALQETQLEVQADISKMRSGIAADRSLNCGTGFVTFFERRDQVVALKLFSPDDSEELVCISPPDPADIIWTDLQVNQSLQWVLDWVGLAVLFGMMAFVLNSVVWMNEVLSAEFLSNHIGWISDYMESHSSFESTWDGLAAEASLSIVLSVVPTLLMVVFYACWELQARAWIQVYMQRWYFVFLVIQTVLAAVIGTQSWNVVIAFLEKPSSLLTSLGTNVPCYSHFWASFLFLEMGSHSLQLARLPAYFKYCIYRIFYNGDVAHGLTEPEPQDYSGLGARYARFTYQFALWAVYSVMSPLVFISGALNFLVCRIVYVYLFVYAEIRKPDLGGVFFVTALKHLQYILALMILVMCGLIREEAETHAPVFLCAASAIPLMYFYYKFEYDLRWELLEFWELLDPTGMGKQPASKDRYIQPELEEFASERNVFTKASQRVKEAIDEFQTRLERSNGC